MIDAHLVLQRQKDDVRVITLAAEPRNRAHGGPYKAHLRHFVPVRYVATGRKGYLKGDVLEADWIVVGKADPDVRWDYTRTPFDQPSAAALEDLRELDIAKVRKRILRKEFPDYEPSQNSIGLLEGAIHAIMSGV